MCIENGEGSRFLNFEGEEKKEKKEEDKFDFLHIVMPRRLNNK